MTVATSIANTQPGAADPSPLAARSDKGLGRAFQTSSLGTTQGFASALQSALTVETSTGRAERPFSARESRTPVSRASQDFLPAKPSRTPTPEARPDKATSEPTPTDRPEPARAAAAKTHAGKPDPSLSEPDRPNEQQTGPATRTSTSAPVESAVKDRPVSAESAPTVSDEPDTATEAEAGEGLVATPVSSAPLPEPVPEVYWGDLEGPRLATGEAPLVNGADEVEAAGDGTANEALSSLRPALHAVAPQENSGPQLESTSLGPIRLAIRGEADDEEQATLPADPLPQRTPEHDKSVTTAAATPTGMVAVPVAATPVAANAVPVPAADHTSSLSERASSLDRRLSERQGGPQAGGADIPAAAELTTPSMKNPIAFTMQMKVAESGPETAGPAMVTQTAASQPAVPGLSARMGLEAGSNLTLPNADAESVTGSQPVSGPVATATGRATAGDREPQQERHSRGETSAGQEQPSPSGQPMPGAKNSMASTVSAPTSARVEAAGAVRSPAPGRTITSTEAVANAGGTRAEQVRNLPRPVGPQRLALRVDPPPVAGTSAAPAPGRAVELYLEQRGADVHFAVRSADPSMVSDLQGSVKDLSNRLEQAGFRTESFLPSDAVRGAGQSQAANNSGPRDDEPSQRQPGENPQGQSGNQSHGRDPRQNRDGQQPRWRNEFEEMFGGTATPAAAFQADR